MPILSWEDAAGSEDGIVNIEGGFAYDMGGMTANVSFLDQSDDGSATAYSADDALFTGTEGFDPDSSLKLLGVGGDGSAADETMTATIDFSANDGSGFSDNVSDVAFRVNDLDLGPDNSDIVTILAYDAEGNLVPVTLTPTSTMTQTGNTVTGNDTEYYPDEEEASLLVEIEGPVSRIVIEYANGGMGEQRVHVTDVHYSTIDDNGNNNGPVDGTEDDDVMLVGFVDTDNDTIDGADGDDDTILGYEGDDTIDGGEGVDTIYGGDDADTILLQDGQFDDDLIEGGEGGDDQDTLDTTGVTEDVTVTFDGNESGDVVGETSGDDADFSEIEAIITGGGDDTIEGSVTDDGIDVTTGGGDDTVIGGTGDDTVDSGDDDDTVTTGDGSDTVDGGGGDDVIDTSGPSDAIDHVVDFPTPFDALDQTGDPDPTEDMDVVDGGDGNDTITTGDDADTVFGGSGDDTIDSGIDDDLVEGGAGNDSIDAGLGADEVYGGDGDDFIDAGIDAFTDYANDDPLFPFVDPNPNDGMDTVYGGDGNDTILTGDDADTIFGDAGNDTIDAGIDDDLIEGGAGDDSIDGGHGSDLIFGGEGNDTINAAENFGAIPPGIGEVVDALDPEPTNGLDTVFGEEGNDTIYGGDDADVLFGGDDDDELYGGIDNDDLFGGSGEDLLEGGQGSDTLDGGTGADVLDGGLDDDDLTVGAGDTATGGFGDDVFFIDADDTDGTTITIDGSDGGEGDPADTTNDNYPGAPLPNGDVLDLTNLFSSGLAESGSITYTSDDNEDGFVTLTDGTVINFEEIENIICFTRGTMIVTDKGEKYIEDLVAGDKVLTKDNGLQELRWMGSRTVPATGTFAPIMIKAGAMANDRDLMVSPQHRMVVEGWKSELLFGEREVLAAAKHLVNNDTIFVKEGGEVEYFHMLFDTHEIVFANGAASESFHPGEVGISALSEASRDEVFALFPELRDDASSYGPAARTSLKGHEAKVLSENPDFLN